MNDFEERARTNDSNEIRDREWSQTGPRSGPERTRLNPDPGLRPDPEMTGPGEDRIHD